MDTITSPLVKSGVLAIQSAYFPQMVQAAAMRLDVPYTTGLLRHAAAFPSVVDAVVIYREGSVDAWLIDQGGALDQVLLDAVTAYDSEGA